MDLTMAKGSYIFFIIKIITFNLKQHFFNFIMLITCLIIQLSYFCIVPFVYKRIFDVAIPEKNITDLIYLLILIAVLFILLSIVNYLQTKLTTRFGISVVNQLRLQLYRRSQNLNVDCNKKTEEKLLKCFSEDLPFLEQALVFNAWTAFQYLIISILSICLLFLVNWQIATIVLVLAPFIYIYPKFFQKMSDKHLTIKKQLESITSIAEKEAINMRNTIKLINIKSYKRKQFKQLLKEIAKISYLCNMNISLTIKSTVVGINIISFVILAIGVYWIMLNEMTLGSLMAAIFISGNLTAAINIILSSYPNLNRGNQSLKHVFELISENIGQSQFYGQTSFPPLPKNILLNNVNLVRGKKHVLFNINLKIQAGHEVAFVGLSGAGKTTLLQLLLREFIPTSGNILIDDIDLNSFSSHSLYEQIRVVPQNPQFFETTIKENIRLGRLDATDEEIINAAKNAAINEEILALPLGYDTPISERSGLSGGQLQRVAIARTLVSNPTILLLDEITSSLDSITASILTKNLMKSSYQHTLICVTHRLQSVVNMDYIYVLDKGKIVEEGTHRSLLKQNGWYSKLWEKQHGIILSDDLNHAKINISWLKSIPFFQQFDENILTRLSEEFLLEKVEAETILFDEGDFGNKFYIIAVGQVEISQLDKTKQARKSIAQLTEGDFFGELALLFSKTRSARATTKSDCILLTLYSYQFNKFVKLLPEKLKNKLSEVVKKRTKAS